MLTLTVDTYGAMHIFNFYKDEEEEDVPKQINYPIPSLCLCYKSFLSLGKIRSPCQIAALTLAQTDTRQE